MIDTTTYRIAGMIFANSLVTQLHHFDPHLDPSIADHVRHSVTYIFTLPKDQQIPVIEAYSKAIGYIFLLPIPCGILASLSAMWVYSSLVLVYLFSPSGALYGSLMVCTCRMIRDHDIRNMNLSGGGGA